MIGIFFAKFRTLKEKCEVIMQNLKINKYKIIACVAAFVLIATFICTLCVSSVFETKIANGAVDFKTVGKSGFLVDVATGTVLYSRNEKERLPIAVW